VPRLRPSIAVLAAATVLPAGCGSAIKVAAEGTLRVALSEYHVQPQRVDAAAGTLTLLVHNYGRLTHNLVISLDGKPQASTRPIAPGQTTELFATLAPGKYLMSSTILSDQALGAYGTLNLTH
jgi:hypothetical protein